jgi:predicted nucleotidyltransferase
VTLAGLLHAHDQGRLSGSRSWRVVTTADMGKTSPTGFAELDGLLEDLASRVGAILGGNCVGVYLQGSFALGDADVESDCDFIVVTEARVTSDQEAGLRALHHEIPTRDGYWTRRLEGSYAPAEELRTLAALGEPWLYIDNGWQTMQWSAHCNTEVVRWTLREHGVTLRGPDPKRLVDEVAPEVLRGRMVREVAGFLPNLRSWTTLEVAWSQRYAVATLCRMLHTAHTGRLASKMASLLWAEEQVDPTWRPLLRRAREDRALGWDPDARPTPESVTATEAFAEYAKARVR